MLVIRETAAESVQPRPAKTKAGQRLPRNTQNARKNPAPYMSSFPCTSAYSAVCKLHPVWIQFRQDEANANASRWIRQESAHRRTLAPRPAFFILPYLPSSFKVALGAFARIFRTPHSAFRIPPRVAFGGFTPVSAFTGSPKVIYGEAPACARRMSDESPVSLPGCLSRFSLGFWASSALPVARHPAPVVIGRVHAPAGGGTELGWQAANRRVGQELDASV